MRSAQKSIKTRARSVRGGSRRNMRRGTFGFGGASMPGTPHHTRKGLSRRATVFNVDKMNNSVYIGPLYSMIDKIGGVMERGEKFRGGKYPKRAVMKPALRRTWPVITKNFSHIL